MAPTQARTSARVASKPNMGVGGGTPGRKAAGLAWAPEVGQDWPLARPGLVTPPNATPRGKWHKVKKSKEGQICLGSLETI